MIGLKVKNWGDWEKLCCYFMQHIVLNRYHQNVQYQSYGSQGQSQYGIDLVPCFSPLPVVGQCKLRETSFTWNMVLEELGKTNTYANPIEYYILFTTANRHTTVQDIQNQGQYYHKRPDGSKFQVHVLYWEDIPNLDFVPREDLERIFPEAFKIAAPPQPCGPSYAEFLAALPIFKAYITRIITINDLQWLENWNFSCGYVPEENFQPFNTLYFEHDRVVKGIPSLLYEGTRMELAAALPAGSRFFAALSDFRTAVNSQIIGDSLPNGRRILSLKEFPDHFVSKVTKEWKLTATHLAQVYREDVLGEPRG